MEDIFDFSDWAVVSVEDTELYSDYMLSDIAKHYGLSVASVGFHVIHEPIDIPTVDKLSVARSCWVADISFEDSCGRSFSVSVRPLFWRDKEDEFPVQVVLYSELRIRRYKESYLGKRLPPVWYSVDIDGSLHSGGGEILSFSSLSL